MVSFPATTLMSCGGFLFEGNVWKSVLSGELRYLCCQHFFTSLHLTQRFTVLHKLKRMAIPLRHLLFIISVRGGVFILELAVSVKSDWNFSFVHIM